LVATLPDSDQLVFAVDVTTWPRCDAECSPARGYYYHPSRHSAGQPIIAGWAYQRVAQVSFDRDSWTAPVDARRLHPLDDTDQTAAAQIRTLLGRLPDGGAVPLFVFDAGYDSAQLSLDLIQERVAVLVRLRADRCFYADPPAPPAGKTGRPRRHGAKFNCTDPTTWPAPTDTLVLQDDQYGTVTVQAWAGLHPKQRHPATAPAGPGRLCAARSSASRSSGCLPTRAHPRCCGCGGPDLASSTWTWPGAPTFAGSTWRTPSGSVSRPLGGRPRGRVIPSRPTAGSGWCWSPTPSCGWPALSSATNGCRGSGPDRSRACRPVGCGAGFHDSWSHSARRPPRQTRRPLSRPAQGQPTRTRQPLPGHQETHHQAKEEGHQDRQGRLTRPPSTIRPPTRSAANQARAGLNHKLRGHFGTSSGDVDALVGLCDAPRL
jgi:hypothetical protein